MRKYMFVALVALCLAVPGIATGNPLSMVEYANTESTSYRIDPQLVQDILKAAAGQCEYDYATLQGWYDVGTLTIEKAGENYQVRFDGGIGIIIIEDSF